MALQIGLAAGVLAALPLALARSREARAVLLAGAALFGLTTLPLARRGLAHDPTVGAMVPALTFLRATAQGFGILGGLIASLNPRAEG
jgi:hypothetical protein